MDDLTVSGPAGKPRKKLPAGWIVFPVLFLWCGFFGCQMVTYGAENEPWPAANKQVASPGVVSGLVTLGANALAEKRFQEAAGLYSRALAIEPDRVDLLLLRAHALEMSNQSEKALNDYRRVLQIDSGNVRAMLASASMLEMMTGGEGEALRLYKKALSFTTDAADSERITFCIAVLESRMQDESLSAAGCWNIGNRQMVKGDLNAAELSYSKALDLNPKFFQAYYSRALVRIKKNQREGALQDLTSAIRLCPTLRGCLVTRGLLYESNGMMQEALTDLKRAAVVDPRDPEAHYHLGRLQETEKAYGEALTSYLEAMRWKPKPELKESIRQRIATLASFVRPKPRPDMPQRLGEPLW